MNDTRYDHALAAALAIIDEMQAKPGMAKHEILSLIIFSFLHAMDAMGQVSLEPSNN